MRKFSRSMPKAPEKRVIQTSTCLLTALLIVLLALAYSTTAFLLMTGIIILIAVMDAVDRRRLCRLAASREGENICTFARSFNRRSIDPWIIRAVYEEFRAYYDGALPIRATDRIEDDLGMDWEDFDEMVADIAFRANRSLNHAELNPMVRRVSSVSDLVLFLSHQPRMRVA
jgi:hypothetical protein